MTTDTPTPTPETDAELYSIKAGTLPAHEQVVFHITALNIQSQRDAALSSVKRLEGELAESESARDRARDSYNATVNKLDEEVAVYKKRADVSLSMEQSLRVMLNEIRQQLSDTKAKLEEAEKKSISALANSDQYRNLLKSAIAARIAAEKELERHRESREKFRKIDAEYTQQRMEENDKLRAAIAAKDKLLNSLNASLPISDKWKSEVEAALSPDCANPVLEELERLRIEQAEYLLAEHSAIEEREQLQADKDRLTTMLHGIYRKLKYGTPNILLSGEQVDEIKALFPALNQPKKGEQ